MPNFEYDKNYPFAAFITNHENTAMKLLGASGPSSPPPTRKYRRCLSVSVSGRRTISGSSMKNGSLPTIIAMILAIFLDENGRRQ